jgi:hypothetical protein
MRLKPLPALGRHLFQLFLLLRFLAIASCRDYAALNVPFAFFRRIISAFNLLSPGSGAGGDRALCVLTH